MPDNVMDAVRSNKSNAQRRMERMKEAKPDMERKAAIQIDRSELNALKRDLEMYKGMVRVAEVQNAQNRLGKVNRFAVMDRKGRDLDLKSTDDAPLLPEDGQDAFTFENAGNIYRSELGAKGSTYRDGGKTVDTYWFNATAKDGSPALVQAKRVTQDKTDAGDAPAPKMEVIDVFDTSSVVRPTR